MTGASFRRSGAFLISAGLLASVALVTNAAEAQPQCGGKPATIVGTNKADVIVGTKRADVIVARGGDDIVLGRGGNDIICGGPGLDRLVGNRGRDRLYGGLGRDRLFGGVGPDRLFGGALTDLLDGGVGVDLCRQGPGVGSSVRCEIPVTRVELIAPAPGAQIAQNDPAIGCPAQPTRGYGFQLDFDWSGPKLEGRGTYHLRVWHEGSVPLVFTELTRSEFSFGGCRAFIADHNLTGWWWRVTAHYGHRRTAVSETRPFSFMPCRLAGDTPCNAPP